MTISVTSYTLAIARTKRVKVWDIGVRLFHWSVVASVALAWFSTDDPGLHRNLGSVVTVLIAFRLVWGLVGSHHARFGNFVPGPRKFLSYVEAMRRGREKRYLGHNPAAAAMVVALLAMLAAVAASGYMMGMPAFFGVEWVALAHKYLVNGLLVLIALHVMWVALASWRHRENLVLAMITGEKEAGGQEAVKTVRRPGARPVTPAKR